VGQLASQLYEDDLKTRAALEGSAFAKTDITCTAGSDALTKGGRMNVTIGASVGDFSGKLAQRAYDIRVHTLKPPSIVTLHSSKGDVNLAEQQSLATLDYVASGWFFCKVDKVVHVKTPSISTSSAVVVELSTGPMVPHVASQECTKSASQTWSKASDGRITLRGDTSTCLTVSTDKDSDSGTPALEMVPCDASLDDKQKWSHDNSNNLRLVSDADHCIDLDRTDHMAEMYGCGNAQPNQQWIYESKYGAFTNAADGTCFTVTGPMELVIVV